MEHSSGSGDLSGDDQIVEDEGSGLLNLIDSNDEEKLLYEEE